MKLIFQGEPKAVQSARFCKIGNFMRSYQPKQVVEWKNYIKFSAMSQLPEGYQAMNAGVYVKNISFIFTPLKSFSKRVKARIDAGELLLKTTKPDLTDNLAKGLIDALKGVVFADDSQICITGKCFKAYGLNPRIEIEVEEIEDLWLPT